MIKTDKNDNIKKRIALAIVSYFTPDISEWFVLRMEYSKYLKKIACKNKVSLLYIITGVFPQFSYTFI